MRTAIATTLLTSTLCALAPAAGQQDGGERAPMTIEDLFEVRSVEGAAVSPDGRTVAYLLARMPDVANGEKDGAALREVRVTRGAGQDRLFVPEDVRASSVGFLDDETLLYLASEGGVQALWRLPLSGGAAEPLFEHSSSISRYALSEDGRTLFFTSRDRQDRATRRLRKRGFDANVTDEDARFTRLYRVDLGAAEPEARRLEVTGQVSTLAASPDGSLVAVGLAPSPLVADDIINKKVVVLDGGTGGTVGTARTEGKVGAFAFSPDGARLGFLAGTGRHDASAHTVAVMDLGSGETRFLTGEDEADEVDLAWTGPDTMRVLAHEGTGSASYTLSADGRVSDRVQHDGFVVTEIAGGGDGFAAVATSPQHPPALYHADQPGSLSKWTGHNEGWLSRTRLYPQRVVRYQARDGVEVEGVLVEPAEPEGRKARRQVREDGAPTIVVVHGGPEAHYVNGWLTGYSTPGQVGAGEGFAVFYPNYRGSTGRGQAFASLDHENPPAAEFDDVVDGIDYLADEGVTDPERVGITGGSYGGYASAWGATKLTDRFRAAVVFVALTDLRSFMGTTDIPGEMVDSHFRQTPEEAPEVYAEQSPVTHAAQSTTPTLILHGEADPRVHPSQSLQLYRTMQRLSDAPVRLVTYPGEGHGNRRAASQYDYAHRMMRWFETYLRGERTDEKPPAAVEAVRALEGGASSD